VAAVSGPYGECVITRTRDPVKGVSLHVDRADPVVLISAELVDEIADNPSPGVVLDLSGCETYMGALLKIRAVNRDVIYRLTGWLPRERAFVAEWPD
jgi:hypothetical protein